MYRIGIDLGGTNIAAAIVNNDFKIVKKMSVPTGAEREAALIMDDMALLCKNVCLEAGIDFSEEKAKEILLCDDIKIVISLGDGNACATAYGCDLTYEYVKINGDYRT